MGLLFIFRNQNIAAAIYDSRTAALPSHSPLCSTTNSRKRWKNERQPCYIKPLYD